MATIIRSVHNNLTLPITLSHTNITLPASTIVDLYTVVTGVELLQIQSELAAMVTSGSISVVLSDDENEVLAILSGKPDVGTVAAIEGSFSVTDVHADIPTTTIFTPTVSGMYLLSFYGLATTAPSGTDAAPNLYTSWTDTHGTQTCFDFAGNLDQTYTDGPNSSTRPIYAVAGQPITFRTSAGDYSGTVRWSFYFAVTKV